jgi:hypothetical protein
MNAIDLLEMLTEFSFENGCPNMEDQHSHQNRKATMSLFVSGLIFDERIK